MINYCFVLDSEGNQLSPTKEVKGWYMIRKGKAKLVSKYPMVIQLRRKIKKEEISKNEVRCGIDDGSCNVGISLVEKCRTKNKVLFKGTIELRKDVKYLLKLRKNSRIFHRHNKRYRKMRFDNRSSSKRNNRIAPSILQKKQSIIRVIKSLNKWIKITKYYLEDVAIDIRALTDNYKLYNWEYQQSNRLDENIRKAVILRDGCKCMECNKTNLKLEVHHIKPRRLNGSNTLNNLITLCSSCHQKTEGVEERYMEHYFNMLGTLDNKNLNYASYVMQGKYWLRKELQKLGELRLTNGGNTANKRIDWNIEKTHSNDAICITDLKPNDINVKEWIIKPIRKKSRAKIDNVLEINHRDLVEYTFKNGETYRGYVTALYPEAKCLSFKSLKKHCNKIKINKCKLLWKFSKIYWFDIKINSLCL